MLLVDDVDNKEFLTGLFNSMYDEFLLLAVCLWAYEHDFKK